MWDVQHLQAYQAFTCGAIGPNAINLGVRGRAPENHTNQFHETRTVNAHRPRPEMCRTTRCDTPGRTHYPSTLFTAEEAFTGSCTAKSTIFTANIAAGMMVEQFTKWLRGLPADLAPRTRIDEHISLSVLRSRAMAFLVTRRTATQIVVEHGESNWLGQWRGVLWATVQIHYGVDLEKIQPRDIR